MDDWLENVLNASSGLLGEALSLTATALRVGPRAITVERAVSIGRDERREKVIRLANELSGQETLDRTVRTAPPATTLSELLTGSDLGLLTVLSHRGRTRDTRRFIARASAERCVVFGAQLEARETLADSTRARWRRVAFHVGAGYRLRLSLESASLDGCTVEAVLDADGAIRHAAPSARSDTARDLLRATARRVERARSALRSDPDEALDLWEGLVRGRWSLVEHFDSDRRRFVVAHRNPLAGGDPRGLAPRERDCAELLGRGFTPKEIAYGIGLSSITVNHALVRARAKLGFQSLAELAAFFAPGALRARFASFELAGEPLAVASFELLDEECLAALTSAEREIALALLRGATNRAIAAERSTSPQTVANQIGALYAKLGVHSRAELAAALGRPATH